ncbi:hypothetical protein B0H13DRAFT_2326098 [Mycena leptocephala]|nr:hypothetical protein B0H13DRAFT_2326098 [Mycena leptocephala]
MEALVESFLALPVAQRNFLKFDIIFQNDQLKDHIMALGFPEPQPTVCLRCEYETEANWVECLKDPDFVKAMDAERSWGFRDGACIFSADLVNKLDSGVPRDRNVACGIFMVPAHMSYTSFQQRMEALIDGVFDLTAPSLSSNMYVQNQKVEEHLQAAGYRSSQPALVVVTETQTMDEVIQVVNHAKVKNLIEAGKKDFSVHNDSIIFSADVVAKFKRPTA